MAIVCRAVPARCYSGRSNLEGEKPADLPVEQPTDLRACHQLKSAKPST